MNRTAAVPNSGLSEARSPASPGTGKFVLSSSLDRSIAAARDALISQQHQQGFWVFELEADCTIPAEYVLMMHFLGEIDTALESRIAAYLRARQAQDGGWPLYFGGELDISCTVKAYLALKLVGDSVDAPHMRRARTAILERGGAARCNVFTRITLALFGQVPWRAVPYIPVEIMLLPRWFPFHLDKVSYWSRTVMVPLFILCTKKPLAKNPRRVDIAELFTTPPDEEHHYFRSPGKRPKLLARLFFILDRCGRAIDPLIPKPMRTRAIRRAETWVLERLNGEDGLGAIFPAMVNALEALYVLGYAKDDPRCLAAKGALEKLLVNRDGSTHCQPCVSPVWDSALAALAMQEEDTAVGTAAAERALQWLQTRQLLDEPGDWRVNRPALAGGGWAFQFSNSYYPDLDDAAAIVWAMARSRDAARYACSVERALDWLVGMQSSNGGFAAFDVDNVHYELNYIPFADHGALLDPPTSDVTARVVTALSITARAQDRPAFERALAYLRQQQESDGSWFGRWGTNHIYGTWSVLAALAQARVRPDDEAVRRAVRWLNARRNPDGGWGESNDTYVHGPNGGQSIPSTSFQSAWALLGLMASGEVHSAVVREGIDYLLRTQNAQGLWSDASFTAPGFPRVFYLKYHGYSAYFPLWALAAYRNLTRGGGTH